jgi:hypothetical protein
MRFQVVRSSSNVEGSSNDDRGSSNDDRGRASKDPGSGVRFRASFIGRRRKPVRGCPTLFPGRGKRRRGPRSSERGPGKDGRTPWEGRSRSRDAPSRSREAAPMSGELNPRSGEVRTRPSDEQPRKSAERVALGGAGLGTGGRVPSASTLRHVRSNLLREDDVDRLLARYPLDAAIAQRPPIYPLEQGFASSEQHRR